jgi:hypothetical protein
VNTYIYSKWINGPVDAPVEFYSELDPVHWETRKVEVFRDGRYGFASATQSTLETRLAIIPIPPVGEIQSQREFEARSIEAAEFEDVWQRAIQQSQFGTSKGTQPSPLAAARR